MEKMTMISSRLCLAADIGNSGNLFGGKLMLWMDEAAAMYAMKLTHEPKMVSRRFSEVLFHSPVKQGEILEFYTSDPCKGNTSVTFRIHVFVEGEERFNAECTFVAIDDSGRKKAIDWSKTELR